MRFSILGIAYISIIIYFAVKRKKFFINVLLLSTLADLFLDMGYIVTFGEKSIDFCELPRHILLFFCMANIFSKNFCITRSWLWLSICCIIPVILLELFPSDSNVANFEVSWDEILVEGEKTVHPVVDEYVIAQTRVFLSSSFILLYIYRSFSYQDYFYYISKLTSIVKIFVFLGVLEFLTKNILLQSNLWGETMELLWGKNEALYTSELNRGSYYDLNLFTQEPSHWAYSLFICSIIIFSTNINKGINSGFSISLLFTILLMMMSLSFSSLLFLFGFFILFLIYRWYFQKPKTIALEKKILVLLLLVTVIGMSSFLLLFPDNLFATRLLFIIDNFTVLFGVDESRLIFGIENGPNLSVIIRILSVMYTLLTVCFRPIFGYGLGTMTCHGSTALLISGIGFFGLYVWTKFAFYSIPLKRMVLPKSHFYIYAILLYLTINLFNSLSLRPFYDLSLFSTVISFILIFSKVKFNNSIIR